MKDNSMDQVDLLKIDVEGAEYEIFESISSDDLKRFKHLLIEFHNNHGGRINQIIEKIKSANFEIDLRDDDTRFKANLESERGTIFATIIK
jgi:hypothetical protein